jgi:hypothetical protein
MAAANNKLDRVLEDTQELEDFLHALATGSGRGEAASRRRPASLSKKTEAQQVLRSLADSDKEGPRQWHVP